VGVDGAEQDSEARVTSNTKIRSRVSNKRLLVMNGRGGVAILPLFFVLLDPKERRILGGKANRM